MPEGADELAGLERRREELYRELGQVGDFRRGSLNEVRRKCGKPGCACDRSFVVQVTSGSHCRSWDLEPAGHSRGDATTLTSSSSRPRLLIRCMSPWRAP